MNARSHPTALARVALQTLVCAATFVAGCASGGGDEGDATARRADTGLHLDTGVPEDTGIKPDAGMDAGEDAGPICVDTDGDGFGDACSGGPDCDDSNASVSPAGTEVCNGVDDNCDGSIDEGLDTPVFCGVGECHTSVPQCSGGTTSTCTPLAAGTEICNALDDDCDGMTDEGFGGTTCGIGACQTTVAACMGGSPPPCVPGSPGTEICNGVDDDCDGTVDDGLGNTSCGRGLCTRSVPACTAGVPGVCVPGSPTTESCNGMDDNCDGVVDDGFGALTCGQGACRVTVASCAGGVPMSCTPGTPTAETCNGTDDDCDGTVDNGLGNLSCGVGYCLRTPPACVSGAPQTCTPGTPMPSEVCGNGVDDNCNGSIDEGCVTCTPPANTTCASAATYSIGSTVMGDNTCSVADVSSTCGSSTSGNDTTYRFTSDGSATRYTITMTGPSGYDTVLHAHSSSACNAGDELACTDDSGSVNVSTLTLDGPPQGTVYIVTDSFTTSGASTFTLTSSTSVLNNDTCSSPIAIRANGTYTGTTSGRADNYTASCAFAGITTAPDVVYSLLARTSGTITLDLCGASYDSVLMVGTTCGTGNVACNDDDSTHCGGTASYLTFSATAGTTYYITVDGYSSNSGSYSLVVSGY